MIKYNGIVYSPLFKFFIMVRHFRGRNVETFLFQTIVHFWLKRTGSCQQYNTAKYSGHSLGKWGEKCQQLTEGKNGPREKQVMIFPKFSNYGGLEKIKIESGVGYGGIH